MKAKKFDTFEQCDMQPGSYALRDDSEHPIFITLPCGHNFVPDKRWQMQDLDDENKITISPTIFWSPQVPCWHGFLRNGEFIPA